MMINEFVKNPEYRKALGLPGDVTESYTLLAQGEYNINYMFAHPVTGRRLILRVNTGSQMHLDRQIEYEAHALRILKDSGRTPGVLYVDGSKKYTGFGILVMDHLPGRYPVYESRSDMQAVMACMADIHSVHIPDAEVISGEPFGEGSVPRDTVRLIAPASAAGSILDECEQMAAVYTGSGLADESVSKRLAALLEKGRIISGRLSGNTDTFRCCINTELNSTNFLIDDSGYARLVDWEKPLYGDPAQDLGHLLAPTTTFWKTDTVLSEEETDRLIGEYISAVSGRFDTEGMAERIRELINITCLRGLSWCAMAWVEYRDPGRIITNESTRKKLDDYLSDGFLTAIEKRFETA